MVTRMTEKVVRIGGASGYWGDSASGPRQLVEKGDIHYLVFDYLAEVTMSILAKLRSRSEEAGYAHDFVTMLKPLIGTIAAKRIKVVANAGGVNLPACRAAIEQVAKEAGVALRIGTVEGDDLMPRLGELRALDLREMQTGAPLPERLLSANAYLGAFPIAAALATGADIVITGRCVDSAVVLGPLIHEFGWSADDYDRLAAGSLAGHLLECGAQVTGGIFTDWEDVAGGWEDMGYPIAEVKADGSFTLAKPAGTGGLVSALSVGEQLLYEIGDPRSYILPDVVCDFAQVRLIEQGRDRVRVDRARGRAPTSTYKVSATYPGGYASVGAMVVSGYDATARARRNGEAIVTKCRRMLGEAGLKDFSRTAVDVIGAETLYGANARDARTLREVVLRVAVRHERAEGAELFSKEYVGSGLSMAAGRCGIAAGRPAVSPVIRLHSCLIDKARVPVTVSVDGKPAPYTAATASAPDRPPGEILASAGDLPPGRRIDVPLIRLAVARSGDKGNDSNIGVMARRPEYLPAIRAALTPAAVKRYFAHYAEGPVERYELPGIHALNFVLRDSLGGGGTSSANLDTQAKTYAQLLLAFPVPVPEGWGNELGLAS
jgi:acyclic terpene utilization AtuA family protein